MSLFYAILEEEYKDSNELWITQRSDGLSGSGTSNDPADGGVVKESALSGTSEYKFNTPNNVVLVMTADKHGYSNLDSITFTGVGHGNILGRGPLFTTATITVISDYAFTYPVPQIPEASPDPMLTISATKGSTSQTVRMFWPVAYAAVTNHGYGNYEVVTATVPTSAALTGDFIVIGVDPNKNTGFYYQLTTYPASGISAASATFARNKFRFDDRMNGLPTNALVRLGSAPLSENKPFKTRGVCSAFVIEPSVGSPDNWTYYAGFRAKSGQKFRGSGIDVTTVQMAFAVDQLTQSTILGRLGSPSLVSNCVLSDLTFDCNMQGQLKTPNKRNSYGLAAVAVGGVALYGSHIRMSRLRAINFGTQCQPEAFVFYTNGGSTAANNEDLARNGERNNVIEDCIVEDPSPYNFHEITAIWPHGSNGDGFQKYIQANGSACVARRNYLNFNFPTRGSSQWLKLKYLDSAPPVLATGLFTFHVQPPLAVGFNRVAGDNVVLAGVYYVNGALQNIYHPYYNGSFFITSVTDLVPATDPPTKVVVCQMLEVPSAAQWSAIGTTLFLNIALVGTDFHGPIAYNCIGGVVESNVAFDCLNPGYTDTGSSRDVAVRGNYYSDSFYAFYQNLSPGVTSNRDFQNLFNSIISPFMGDAETVRVTCASPHFLSVGDVIKTSNIISNGNSVNLYNGTYPVSEIVDATTFHYQLRTVPPFAVDSPPYLITAVYLVYGQTRRALLEGNLLDMDQNTPYTYPVPQGSISVVAQTDVEVIPGWVIRDNIIRHTDGIPTNLTGLFIFSNGLRMSGLSSCLLESNTIDLEAPHLLQILNPNKNIHTFQNRKLSGELAPGYLESTGKTLDDAITAIEDVLSISI